MNLGQEQQRKDLNLCKKVLMPSRSYFCCWSKYKEVQQRLAADRQRFPLKPNVRHILKMRKARVFISCGQRTDREKNIGMEVDRYFKERGFDTYFAEKVHSPEALTEHIFTYLKESEYFVFIDFKREKINENQYRGSLFVNQEIGISTFLKIPGIGFHEKKVEREGILKFQIYNAFPFEDGTEIIAKLRDETSNWDPNSVNELHLSESCQ
jgi:hypothetical protein